MTGSRSDDRSPARSCSAAPPERRSQPQSEARRRPMRLRGRFGTRDAGSPVTCRSSSGRTSSPGYNGWFRKWARRVGREERRGRQRRPRAVHGSPSARGHGSKGATRARHLRLPLAAARYEDQVIDHAAIVHQVEKAVGRYGEIGKRSTYNPKTKRYFGVSDYHVPAPLIWRHDVWNSLGQSPATWDHVREAGSGAQGSGASARDRTGERARLERRVDLVLDVLRRVPAGRVRRRCDRQRADDRGGPIHGRSAGARWREHGLRLERGLQQPVRSLGQGVADHECDLANSTGRGSRHAVRTRALDLADPRRAGRPDVAGSVHGRVLRLEVREEPRGGREVHRRRLPRGERGDAGIQVLQLPELSRRAPAEEDLQGRGGGYERRPRASTRSSRPWRRSTRATSATRDMRTPPCRKRSTDSSCRGCSRRCRRARRAPKTRCARPPPR